MSRKLFGVLIINLFVILTWQIGEQFSVPSYFTDAESVNQFYSLKHDQMLIKSKTHFLSYTPKHNNSLPNFSFKLISNSSIFFGDQNNLHLYFEGSQNAMNYRSEIEPTKNIILDNQIGKYDNAIWINSSTIFLSGRTRTQQNFTFLCYLDTVTQKTQIIYSSQKQKIQKLINLYNSIGAITQDYVNIIYAKTTQQKIYIKNILYDKVRYFTTFNQTHRNQWILVFQFNHTYTIIYRVGKIDQISQLEFKIIATASPDISVNNCLHFYDSNSLCLISAQAVLLVIPMNYKSNFIEKSAQRPLPNSIIIDGDPNRMLISGKYIQRFIQEDLSFHTAYSNTSLSQNITAAKAQPPFNYLSFGNSKISKYQRQNKTLQQIKTNYNIISCYFTPSTFIYIITQEGQQYTLRVFDQNDSSKMLDNAILMYNSKNINKIMLKTAFSKIKPSQINNCLLLIQFTNKTSLSQVWSYSLQNGLNQSASFADRVTINSIIITNSSTHYIELDNTRNQITIYNSKLQFQGQIKLSMTCHLIKANKRSLVVLFQNKLCIVFTIQQIQQYQYAIDFSEEHNLYLQYYNYQTVLTDQIYLLEDYREGASSENSILLFMDANQSYFYNTHSPQNQNSYISNIMVIPEQYKFQSTQISKMKIQPTSFKLFNRTIFVYTLKDQLISLNFFSGNKFITKNISYILQQCSTIKIDSSVYSFSYPLSRFFMQCHQNNKTVLLQYQINGMVSKIDIDLNVNEWSYVSNEQINNYDIVQYFQQYNHRNILVLKSGKSSQNIVLFPSNQIRLSKLSNLNRSHLALSKNGNIAIFIQIDKLIVYNTISDAIIYTNNFKSDNQSRFAIDNKGQWMFHYTYQNSQLYIYQFTVYTSYYPHRGNIQQIHLTEQQCILLIIDQSTISVINDYKAVGLKANILFQVNTTNPIYAYGYGVVAVVNGTTIMIKQYSGISMPSMQINQKIINLSIVEDEFIIVQVGALDFVKVKIGTCQKYQVLNNKQCVCLPQFIYISGKCQCEDGSYISGDSCKDCGLFCSKCSDQTGECENINILLISLIAGGIVAIIAIIFIIRKIRSKKYKMHSSTVISNTLLSQSQIQDQ